MTSHADWRATPSPDPYDPHLDPAASSWTEAEVDAHYWSESDQMPANRDQWASPPQAPAAPYERRAPADQQPYVDPAYDRRQAQPQWPGHANQDPVANQAAEAYQDPVAYQDPQAYQQPASYQDPQVYQDLAAYQDRHTSYPAQNGADPYADPHQVSAAPGFEAHEPAPVMYDRRAPDYAQPVVDPAYDRRAPKVPTQGGTPQPAPLHAPEAHVQEASNVHEVHEPAPPPSRVAARRARTQDRAEPPPNSAPAHTNADQGLSVVAQARGLTKVYGHGDTAVHALRGVDVDFARGHLTAIMGPSGSGKSTLMHCMAALDTPTAGQVNIDGIELVGLPDKQLTLLRRERIGFIFQAFNLVSTLSARDNITLPLDIAGTPLDEEWFDFVVRTVGLTERLNHRPSELSGGQQQRVACARALVCQPSLIFADEPTGNLDSKSSADVLGFLKQSVQSMGQSVVMVTHEPSAAAYADRVLFLADGMIVAELRNPTADSVMEYMGELERQRMPGHE